MIDLTNEHLTDVSLDEASTLSLRIGEGWVVSIESDYSVSGPHGTTRTDVDDEAVMVATLEAQVGNPVTQFDVTAAGELTIGIGDTTLVVAPHRSFEAWSISGPHQELIVCTPGGELATWSATDGA